MAEDQPFHMWSYWKGKYCNPVAAIKDYYPNLYQNDPNIKTACSLIETGQEALDSFMSKKEDEQS